jgi:hypothetical protein
VGSFVYEVFQLAQSRAFESGRPGIAVGEQFVERERVEDGQCAYLSCGYLCSLSARAMDRVQRFRVPSLCEVIAPAAGDGSAHAG